MPGQVTRDMRFFQFFCSFLGNVEEDEEHQAIEETRDQKQRGGKKIPLSIGRHADGSRGGKSEGWSEKRKKEGKGKKPASVERSQDPILRGSIENARMSVTGCGGVMVVKSQEGMRFVSFSSLYSFYYGLVVIAQQSSHI